VVRTIRRCWKNAKNLVVKFSVLACKKIEPVTCRFRIASATRLFSFHQEHTKRSISCLLLNKTGCHIVNNIFEYLYTHYSVVPRKQWVLDWPGMTTIVISQMFWTSEVESSVESGANGVRNYSQKCTDQLDELIDLVREKLTKLQRSSIGVMVVLDVHARDMTVNLADEDIRSKLDFSWLAQVCQRVYFCEYMCVSVCV